MLDTKFFGQEFKDRLLASFETLDKQVRGLLIHSESFQALNLLERSYASEVTCIYIDPPFNLGDNADFLYKTNYQDANWLSLLENRINKSLNLLSDGGLLFVRCDYHGSHLVRQLLQSIGLEYKAEILIDRSRNEAGSPNKMENTYEHLFMFTKSDVPIKKFTVSRSLANIKWTGFLMAGDRNPAQRTFLGKTLFPPSGQHFSLKQEKVNKLLAEYYLRLKCRNCSALYYQAESTSDLERRMKAKTERFKFYDITADSSFHGVRTLDNCLDCGGNEFRVEYLGSSDVYVNDNWLDIPSYSRRWGFATENSEELLNRVISFTDGTVLDFLVGSGTTAAVAMKNKRRWLACDMGAYFETVTLRRMKHVLSGEGSGISNDVGWSGGGIFKYMRLESYEDTLNNIEMKRSEGQASLLEAHDEFGEDYVLRYMLDVEARGSASLLNIENFADPFNYQLNLATGASVGETRPVNVDLIETFNYLLGLRVQHVDAIEGFRVVKGTNPAGEKVLVIWRNRREKSNDELDQFFRAQGYNTCDREFDIIYVNGDNNIENLKRTAETWKVRLIEEAFHRLMFDVQDV